jgi:hypothetical protein
MATMSSKRIIVIFLIFVVVTGVINITPSTSQLVTQSEVAPRITRDSNLKTEIVSKGEMKFPTSMAFLSPVDLLILEKNIGTVKRIINGTMLSEPLLDVNVVNKNERGMLGIAIGLGSLIDNKVST